MKRPCLPSLASSAFALTAAASALAQAPIGRLADFESSDSYHIYYGSWDATRIADARDNFRLVVLEPSSNITAADVANIQRGPDLTAGTADDVLVLGYISLGEDNRPEIFDGMNDILTIPGGEGPRVDPRDFPATETLASTVSAGIPTLGDPSPGGTGYARFYVDDDPVDGIPDRNSEFGGAYVNAGDPQWYATVKSMTALSGSNAGLDEIMGTSVGKALGCDGIFIDTLETPAPNSFGGTMYEWTAPGAQYLLKEIRTDFPDKVLLLNRGLFFFSPNFEHYQFSLAPYVQAVMFESYYTTNSDASVTNPTFNDNKYNFAPKINAEANRENGFTVIALGYDEPSTITQPTKDQDFIESTELQGWPLYRTNRSLDDAMRFTSQAWNTANPDSDPPVWDTTAPLFVGELDPAPTPREGVQELVAGDAEITVRWDVARDQSQPVLYNLYYAEDSVVTAIGDAGWTQVMRVAGEAPANYVEEGSGAGRYANEYTLTGLVNGVTYQVAVRAEDSAPTPHEETNTVVLTAMPFSPADLYRTITIDGDMSDWLGVPAYVNDPNNDGGTPEGTALYLANDDDYLYVRVTIEAGAAIQAPGGYNVFVDTDGDSGTGFTAFGSPNFGSELLLQNGGFYQQRGGGFNEGGISNADFAIAPAPATQATDYEFRISRSATYDSDSANVFPAMASLRLVMDLFDGGFASVDTLPNLPSVNAPLYNFATATSDLGHSEWMTLDR